MRRFISAAIKKRVKMLEERLEPLKSLWISLAMWRELFPKAQADGLHVDPATGELLSFEEYQRRWPAKAYLWEKVLEIMEIFDGEPEA